MTSPFAATMTYDISDKDSSPIGCGSFTTLAFTEKYLYKLNNILANGHLHTQITKSVKILNLVIQLI